MQSSTVKDEHKKIDPENKYLARSTRMRIPAENVRDHVLATSGLLNNEVGGPSIKPYQPKGLWEVATSGRGSLATYVQDHGKDLYRRGMYVFIKRTVPPPAMLIFDASNRDQCEVQRTRTNTPLQALAMLNDPHVLESSRVMAQEQLSRNISIDEAIKNGFRKIVCRMPSTKELEILKNYYEEEKVFFKKQPQKIKSLQKIGEYEHKTVKDPVSLAALLQTFQMMFNMEETLIRI
jgi:DNA topoisomerase VI subunit B